MTTITADEDASAIATRKRKPVSGSRSSTTTALLMLLPAAVLLITFLLILIGLTFGLAFTNARLISPRPAEFIGTDNFVRLFQDETFWKALRDTIVVAVVIVPLQSAC